MGLGTGDSWVPGLVEVVELADTQAQIEPIVRHGGVHGPAGGAHVVGVAGGVLHTLQDADLSGWWVEDEVEQWVWPLLCLPVAADHAVRGHLVLYSAAGCSSELGLGC